MFKVNSKLKQKGFTLIELMVVVAIIGILVSIAYPSYQDSITRSRRADAKAALVGFASAMERHFTVNNSYCGAGTIIAGACATASTGTASIYSSTSPIDGSIAYYNLTIEPSAQAVVIPVTANSYNLRATPIGPQIGDGILELSHTEAKGRWDRNLDGDTDDANEQTWD